MRAVVQRVRAARVEVDGAAVAEIGRGMVAFVAVERDDGPGQVLWMADKLVHLRLFEGPAGKLDLSVSQVAGEILLVPNFTVAGDCRRGRRPDFTRAAPGERAAELFHGLVEAVREAGVGVASGRFGASMRVVVENDGPVTLVVDGCPR